MATQTFPKSYLLERIDARLASLERQDVDDVTIVAEYRRARSRVTVKWVKTIAPKARELLETVTAWENAVELDSAAEARKEIEDALTEIPRHPSVPWTGPENRVKEAATRAAADLKKRATERDALTHTRAYLTDTPIEEFSTTALGRLGLMDAVRFSLDDARKAAEAEAKEKRR